jgi:hypothetical protein
MPQTPVGYDTDFYTWTQEQAALLREGAVAELDLANLAEEIESLGISQRHALESRLAGLLMHLLKWRYQPQKRQTSRSWFRTISEHRARIAQLQRDSPSLHRLVPDAITDAYPRARRIAGYETRLPLATFPLACPWSVEQVLSDDFWPEAETP